MAKICNKDNCSYPVFGKGFCKMHQYLRTDKKPKPLKKKAIKPKTRENSGQAALFLSIWYSSDRLSFLSGKPLDRYAGTDFFPNLFAHVLSKAQNKYPKFKLYANNIILLTPEEHTLFDHGTIEQREKYGKLNGCDWEKVYKLKDELIKEYNATYGK
jgi:hypothetical protein